MPIRPILPLDVTLGFDLLTKHLAICPLTASLATGETRRATADEFMLMHVEDTDALSAFVAHPGRIAGRRFGFKQIHSRNYLFIESAAVGTGYAGTSFLIIPTNDAPFMRGEFPADPFEAEAAACTTAPAEVSA
jgi:hypothetical protein